MNPELLAALAGVALHLHEAEEADKARSIAGGPYGPRGTAGAAPWALHGRQSIMRMRTLVQQRVLKR